MATCPRCKTFFLGDECPACKVQRQREAVERASSPAETSDQVSASPANSLPVKRDVYTMGCWPFLCYCLAVVLLLASVATFALSFNLVLALSAFAAAMSLICFGNLCSCVSAITKNQDEILSALDRILANK